MSAEIFTHDVVLSHSSKDKSVVRPLAERFAFEVSEQYPANWRESMPVVLEALKETRGS
jgi:hypothetical protein